MAKEKRDAGLIQVKLRMPIGFHRKLMRDANRNGQTLNAEILKRLEASYLPPPLYVPPPSIRNEVTEAVAAAFETEQEKIVSIVSESMKASMKNLYEEFSKRAATRAIESAARAKQP